MVATDDILRFRSMSLFRRMAVWVWCAGTLGGQQLSPGAPKAPTPEDLATGERLYRTQCASCHGARGEGGRGAALARPHLTHATDDQAMFNVIVHGIADSEMPGHWFPEHEVWQLVAFVRTLGRAAPEKTAGDAGNGERLYRTRGGCAQCHTVGGRGGAVGPDLTDIGARRSPAYLRESLVNPEADVPEGFLEVQLATRDGRRIRGVRLSEDTFSIQVRDLSGEFRSFFKTELKELNRMPGKSPMPGYAGVFTAGELDDVVAYLDSLRGSQ